MDHDGADRRLRTAVELFEFGVGMRRQQLRRASPGATETEIDALLAEWLLHPPGAAAGDRAAGLSVRHP